MLVTEILYIIFILLALVYTIGLLIIGLVMIFRSIKLKLRNILYFGLMLEIVFFSQIGSIVLGFPPFLETLLVSFGLFFFILFANKTFYQDRHDIAVKLVLVVGVINYFVVSTFSFMYTFYSSPLTFYLFFFQLFVERLIVFGWNTFSAYSAYKKIKKRTVEPWILMRYKILTFTSFLMVIQPVSYFFIPYGSDFGDITPLNSFIVFGISVLIILSFCIGTYLAMIMPKWFKNYVNKNYVPSDALEFSEKELIEIIKFLAEYLAVKLNFSPAAARGLLKLAIQDELGTYKQIEEITFHELKLVINNSFFKRLEKLKSEKKIDIPDISQVVKGTLNQLIEGQSLISLSRI